MSRIGTPQLPRIPPSQAVAHSAIRGAAPHLLMMSQNGDTTSAAADADFTNNNKTSYSASLTQSRPTTVGGLDVFDVFERVKGQCLRLWGEVLHLYPTALTAPVTTSFAPSDISKKKGGRADGSGLRNRITKKHLAHIKQQQQQQRKQEGGAGGGVPSDHDASDGNNNNMDKDGGIDSRPTPPLRVALQYYIDMVYESTFQLPTLSTAPTYEQIQTIHSEVEWVIRVRDAERDVLEAIEVREALKYELMGLCESALEHASAAEKAWRDGSVTSDYQMLRAGGGNGNNNTNTRPATSTLQPVPSSSSSNKKKLLLSPLGGVGSSATASASNNNNNNNDFIASYSSLPNLGPNSNTIPVKDIRGCINLLRRASLDVLVAIDTWRTAMYNHQVPVGRRRQSDEEAEDPDENDDELISPAIVYMWRGGSYICRMANDLDFLVQYAVQPLGLRGSRELLIARKREAREASRHQQREQSAQRDARRELNQQQKRSGNSNTMTTAHDIKNNSPAAAPSAAAVVVAVSEEQQMLDEEIDDAIDLEIRQKLPPYNPNQEAIGFFAKSALSAALQAALMHCQISNNPLLNMDFKGFQHASTRYRSQLQQQKRLHQQQQQQQQNGGDRGTSSHRGTSQYPYSQSSKPNGGDDITEGNYPNHLHQTRSMSTLYKVSPPFHYPTVDEISDLRRENGSNTARLATSKSTKSRQLMVGYGGSQQQQGAALSGSILPPLLPDILKSCTSSVPKDTSDEDKKDLHPQLLTWGSQQILHEFFVVAGMYAWLANMRQSNNNNNNNNGKKNVSGGGVRRGHFPISYDALDSAEVDEDVLSDLATIDATLQIPVVYQAPLPDELPPSEDAILATLRRNGNNNNNNNNGGSDQHQHDSSVIVGGKQKKLVDLHATLPKPVSNSGIVFNPEDTNIAYEMYLVFDPNALSPEQQEDLKNQEAVAASVAAYAAQQALERSIKHDEGNNNNKGGGTAAAVNVPKRTLGMLHMTSADLPFYRHRNTTRIARAAEKQFLLLETDMEKEDFIKVCRVQALWRGKVDRSRASAMEFQRQAAKRIQSIVRCREAISLKNTLVTEYRAASRIQAIVRGIQTRKEVAMLRQLNGAATSVQKIYRGYSARRRVTLIKHLFLAATLIQKTFRGMIDRRYAQDLKTRTYTSAATDIQRLWKGVAQRSGRHISKVQLVGCKYPGIHQDGSACGACAAKVTPLRVSQINKKEQ